jgi:uncharacterized FlgJ-related protein
MQHHKYSLTELDNLMPWERQVYIDLLMNYLEEENAKIKEQQRNRILDKRIASLQVESTLEQLNSDIKIKNLDFITRQEERRDDLGQYK